MLKGRWKLLKMKYREYKKLTYDEYGLEMLQDEDEEYLEHFAYECIACGEETIYNPCHHCGTKNPDG